MYSIVFSFRKKEGQELLTCMTCSQQILETFRSQCKNSCRDATPGNEETVWSFDVMKNGNHHSKIKPRQVDVEARWGSIGSCFVVGIWYFFSELLPIMMFSDFNFYVESLWIHHSFGWLYSSFQVRDSVRKAFSQKDKQAWRHPHSKPQRVWTATTQKLGVFKGHVMQWHELHPVFGRWSRRPWIGFKIHYTIEYVELESRFAFWMYNVWTIVNIFVVMLTRTQHVNSGGAFAMLLQYFFCCYNVLSNQQHYPVRHVCFVRPNETWTVWAFTILNTVLFLHPALTEVKMHSCRYKKCIIRSPLDLWSL